MTATVTDSLAALAEVNGRKRLVLVDGYGLAFRAFYGLPQTLATAEGEPTNATFGFTSMLLDVLRVHQPDYIVISFDVGKTFRHEQFEDYKAHRAPMPEEMRVQMARIREVIDALNIPIYEAHGFEADDVIGTLSRQAGPLDLLALIVTGDSDLLQLVDEHVMAILPGAQRFGEYRVYDVEAVIARYGFGPERIPDYKALVGDKSDNIPGVPGIGEKTAKALIQQFPSLEAMYEHVELITPTRARNAIADNREVAFKSRELATVVRDVPLSLELERCVVADYDREKALSLFRILEFRHLAARLPDSVRVEVTPPPVGASQQAVPVLVRDEAALQALAAEIAAAPMIALDVETDSTHPVMTNLVGIAIATADDRAYYVPVRHATEDVVDLAVAQRYLAEPLRSHPKVVTHHGKFDVAVLDRHGFEGICIEFDTMLAGYLLGVTAIGLKDMAFNRLGWQMTAITELIGTGRNQITMDQAPLDQVTSYAGADVEATLRLRPALEAELREREQLTLLETLELPLVPVLVEMERIGIAIDPQVLHQLGAELAVQIDLLEQSIYASVGHSFNISSTKQLATVLFEELGLPSGRRNKTGLSVGQEVLDGLRGAHPAVDAILEYRQLKKLKSTYVDTLPGQVNPATGRIHTTFNQTIAATGRLSSIDPNLQNIPVRTAIGRKVRRAFVADNRPGYRRFDEEVIFFSADYSQMELRLMAHYSQDPVLLDAFRRREDVHRLTAAEVFGVPIAEVTSDQRATAKTVNFGIMYGMQAYGLSRDTGMSRQDSAAFIARYMERFQGVRAFLDQTLRDAVRLGYVSSLYGRRRYVPDITATGPRRQAAERAAINMPLQGTAADIMKLAMIQVRRRIAEAGLRGEMLLQVHDELLFETPVSELEALRAVVVDVMTGIAELSVPLEVESARGTNWDDLIDFD